MSRGWTDDYAPAVSPNSTRGKLASPFGDLRKAPAPTPMLRVGFYPATLPGATGDQRALSSRNDLLLFSFRLGAGPLDGYLQSRRLFFLLFSGIKVQVLGFRATSLLFGRSSVRIVSALG